MVTVDVALEHLENVGLIAVKPAIGSLTGNEYEVFTPEEASTSTSSIASSSRITQKVDELDVPESGSTSTTQLIENSGGWGQPNTSFKTKDINTDDEENRKGDYRQRTFKGRGRALGRSSRGAHDGTENRRGSHDGLQCTGVSGGTPTPPPLEEGEATNRGRGRRAEGVKPRPEDWRLEMSRLLRHGYVLPGRLRQRRGEMFPFKAY